jgi:transcriptional regulator with XRE-family HTH domain
MSTLGDYLRRALFAQSLTDGELSHRSKRGGRKGISREYISQIRNGYSDNLSILKLDALATGLGVPTEELLRVALNRPTTPQGRFKQSIDRLMVLFNNLPAERKARAEHILEMCEREVSRLFEEAV